MNENQRKKIREWFAINYDTDPSKKTGLIAIENRPHFKTGKVKHLIKEFKNCQINVLPKQALEFAKPYDTITSHDITSRCCVIDECRLMEFALRTKFKSNTGRGDVICRNGAIFFNNNFQKNEADKLMLQLVRIQETGSTNWIYWARKNHKSDFSCGEIRQYLRNSGQEIIEQLTCWKCCWKNKNGPR